MKPSLEGGRWRLLAVNIRHFRGVADDCTVHFDGMSGLLHGHNGVGKSTVAQCLQWTLYGEFPKNVLANKSLPMFLTPVEGRKKAYCGEVTFHRGAEHLVLHRDQAENSFTLTIGSRCYRNEEAEAKRDELLGLDMDTFVRAVLLQQSRIRGLLLDEPKERNKALDRLLGMDILEEFMALVQSDDFVTAARTWRSRIENDELRFTANEALLRRQREVAERTAREHQFIAKDFTIVGLQKAYAAVGTSLAAAARKSDVAIDALPPCESLSKAPATHRRVIKALQTIRLSSKFRKRMAPLQERMATLSQFQKTWIPTIDERDRATALLTAWAEKNGSKEEVAAAKSTCRKDIAARKKDLRAANALYELLRDAHAYAEHREIESCPVCEQTLPRGMKFMATLANRIEALTSKDLAELTTAIETGEKNLSALDAELQQRDDLENTFTKAQRLVDRARIDAAKMLECDELKESSVAKRVGGAIATLEKELAVVEAGLATMEDELTAIQEQSQAIRDGLVPLLQKREEQSTHEAEWEARKAAYAEDAACADRMDRFAVGIDSIRAALLHAKDEVASKSLGRAGPRIAALYQKLVRHPRFDTLRLATQRRLRKVDYAFEVSVSGARRTVLEARLALSDGQLTAAALSVFFALAESTAHELDLLYVDDPTQSLDLPCKEALAKVISEIALRKQVIVSTHDEDFVGLLEAEGFNNRSLVHHLTQWDGNPRYETTRP